MPALVPYAGDDLLSARRWSDLPESDRRRRAVTAAQHRDLDELWSLTEAFVVLHGRSGAHLSRHTRRAYRHGIATLLDAWSGENLLHVSRDAGALWIRELERSGLSASTIQVRLAGARALYKALRWSGATNGDPLSDIKPAPDPTPSWDKRSPYSQNDIIALLHVASPDDRVLVLLGAHAGLRVSEALALTWNDIDWIGQKLHVRRGKGGKSRHVPLSGTLASFMSGGAARDGYILSIRSDQQVRNRMRALCARADVVYRGYHSLRHSCGTAVYRQTGKLEAAQHLLGHQDISTTQTYAHWSDESTQELVANW